MPKKSKIRIINVSNKWKTWYIKSKSKTSIVLSYCEIVFHLFTYYQLIPLSIILCYLEKSLTDHKFPGPPKYHLFLAPRPVEPHPTDLRSHFSLEKQKSLNINIAFFFLETLASPNEKLGMTE